MTDWSDELTGCGGRLHDGNCRLLADHNRLIEMLTAERALADRLAKAVRPKCSCAGYEMCSRCADVDSALSAYDAARKEKT